MCVCEGAAGCELAINEGLRVGQVQDQFLCLTATTATDLSCLHSIEAAFQITNLPSWPVNLILTIELKDLAHLSHDHTTSQTKRG